MSRSRSVSPVGMGRFDGPYVPPSQAASFMTNSPASADNANASYKEFNRSMESSPTSSDNDHASEPSQSSFDDGHRSVETAPSSVASHDAHSCGYDADDWFSRFRDDIDVSDEQPSATQLAAAGKVPIIDVHGNSRPFSSLYSEGEAIGERQLILFVRHFYCGACQSYLQVLTKSITMQTYFTMPIPTSIVVIGCGSPALIPHYKAVTQCPFPIFADPSRQLYKQLGMSLSLNVLGGGRPQYMKEVSPPAWLAGQIKQMSKTKGMKKRINGGNWMQIGGEFLFENGEIRWCHRMKNYRGHAEIDVLRRILEIDR